MQHLTQEQQRILRKRILSVLDQARYYPAQVKDTFAAAEHILRAPLTPDQHNSGRLR